MMQFVVMGGAGAMGSLVVKDLVEYGVKALGITPCQVVIADYDLDKARALADSYDLPGLVTAAKADVRDVVATTRLLDGTFAVVNSVQYQHNLKVMEAALAAKSHYIDLGGLFHTTRQQLLWNDRFQAAGLIALLGMGAAPGTTNILARMAADRLDRVEEIHTRLAYIDQTQYSHMPALYTSYSLKTILEELTSQPAVFTGGDWTFVDPRSGASPHHFPPPLGLVQGLIFALHSEVATLPVTYKDTGVKEVSFKLAFDPDFLRNVELLIQLGLASTKAVAISGQGGSCQVVPVNFLNQLALAQKSPVRVGPFKEHEVVRAIVKGWKDGAKVTWVMDFHSDGIPAWDIGVDADTGCPPSIAALMLGAGLITERGAIPPEVAVPPDLYVAELAKRGMRVTEERLEGWDFEV